jgi:hypothetical protein
MNTLFSSPAVAGEGDREAVEGVCAAVQVLLRSTPPLRLPREGRGIHLPRNGGGGKEGIAS